MSAIPNGLPVDGSFGQIVKWLFYDYGARPDGDPSRKIGEPWTLKEITTKAPVISERRFRHWTSDDHFPADTTLLNKKLFGDSPLWDDVRVILRDKLKEAKRKAKPELFEESATGEDLLNPNSDLRPVSLADTAEEAAPPSVDPSAASVEVKQPTPAADFSQLPDDEKEPGVGEEPLSGKQVEKEASPADSLASDQGRQRTSTYMSMALAVAAVLAVGAYGWHRWREHYPQLASVQNPSHQETAPPTLVIPKARPIIPLDPSPVLEPPPQRSPSSSQNTVPLAPPTVDHSPSPAVPTNAPPVAQPSKTQPPPPAAQQAPTPQQAPREMEKAVNVAAVPFWGFVVPSDSKHAQRIMRVALSATSPRLESSLRYALRDQFTGIGLKLWAYQNVQANIDISLDVALRSSTESALDCFNAQRLSVTYDFAALSHKSSDTMTKDLVEDGVCLDGANGEQVVGGEDGAIQKAVHSITADAKRYLER